MKVVGLPFNAPDSVVQEQVELFGGKVKSTPVLETYRDAPGGGRTMGTGGTEWTLVHRPSPWAHTTSWMGPGVELPTQAMSKHVPGP